MNSYTVTFILRDTQSHTTSFKMQEESSIKVTDNILEQIRTKAFVEAYNAEDDTYYFVNAPSIASFNIKKA